MKTIIFLLILAVFLSGCVTSIRYDEKIARVQLGMSKAEVFDVMGPANATSAKDNVEFMRYYEISYRMGITDGPTSTLYIRLIDGKVESYGKVGDFDSTKTPTVRIETDGNVID